MKSAMSNLFGSGCSHARFRFSVIGTFLAAPPERGDLQEKLKSLAAKKWRHPISGQRVQFGLSTIERWFYIARYPVGALQRKIRSDHGGHPALSSKVRELLVAQYRQHPNWGYQLHADNLAEPWPRAIQRCTFLVRLFAAYPFGTPSKCRLQLNRIARRLETDFSFKS
jgi:hypothetical protein